MPPIPSNMTCRLAVTAKDVMIFVPELTDREKAEGIMRVEVFLPDPDASKN